MRQIKSLPVVRSGRAPRARVGDAPGTNLMRDNMKCRHADGHREAFAMCHSTASHPPLPAPLVVGIRNQGFVTCCDNDVARIPKVAKVDQFPGCSGCLFPAGAGLSQPPTACSTYHKRSPRKSVLVPDADSLSIFALSMT